MMRRGAGDGTGRRSGLKTRSSQERTGSIPVLRTKPNDGEGEVITDAEMEALKRMVEAREAKAIARYLDLQTTVAGEMIKALARANLVEALRSSSRAGLHLLHAVEADLDADVSGHRPSASSAQPGARDVVAQGLAVSSIACRDDGLLQPLFVVRVDQLGQPRGDKEASVERVDGRVLAHAEVNADAGDDGAEGLDSELHVMLSALLIEAG